MTETHCSDESRLLVTDTEDPQAQAPRRLTFRAPAWAAVAAAAALGLTALAMSAAPHRRGVGISDPGAPSVLGESLVHSSEAEDGEDDSKVEAHQGGAAHLRKKAEGNADSAAKRHQGRRGSFMVIGDWGYDDASHYININSSCVDTIADRMLAKFEELGDVKFIINVGDSFYPSGVANKWDPQWQKKWRDVFPKKLRSVPWYSVYGNHDYHVDPCACTDDLSKCAQINADEENLDFFVMPSYTYYKAFPDLDMELIGLDMNYFMPGWNQGLPVDKLGFSDCEWTPCKDTCFSRSSKRMSDSVDLFFNRSNHSTAKNLVVFSHYPTDYFVGGAPWMLKELRKNSSHDIVYFGGHRHSTDTSSTESIAPNTNWLVGGGGGWSCDSDKQGFVVGEIDADYSVHTYAELVDKDACCIYPSTAAPNEAFVKK